MKYSLTLAVVLAVGLMAFQNCGKVDFKDANPGIVRKLVPQDDDGSSGTGVVTDQGGESQSSRGEEEEDEVIAPDKVEEEAGVETEGVLARCFIAVDGNLRSNKYKLHVVENDLAYETSTTHAACISKRACEELVANALDIPARHEGDHGPCNGGNPHLVPLDDNEVASLLK